MYKRWTLDEISVLGAEVRRRTPLKELENILKDRTYQGIFYKIKKDCPEYEDVMRLYKREYKRIYKKEHPESIRGQKKRWRERHKTEIAERGKKYRGEHKKELAEKQRQLKGIWEDFGDFLKSKLKGTPTIQESIYVLQEALTVDESTFLRLKVNDVYLQRKFAEDIGVHESTLSKYLKGDRRPSKEVLGKISDKLNVDCKTLEEMLK